MQASLLMDRKGVWSILQYTEYNSIAYRAICKQSMACKSILAQYEPFLFWQHLCWAASPDVLSNI